MIGTVLKHRYKVLEKIGEGNLFTVYKCEDVIENQTAAVKVLLPQYASNRMFAQRILVEAQALVGLQHPGIVEVYDCGEQDGIYYVIVEYVRGTDLKERIRRNAPFSLPTVVDVGLALCDVLDYAHRKGFMHGDLRPGNVLVSPEGQIKIADFWVSNAIAASPTFRTNAMIRSVHYTAPEVSEGKPVAPSSDVYSVGIILYELLTAKLPYDGDNPMAIALKHAHDPIPSPKAINAGVPKALESLIAKAMQKSPNDRFRSAKSMQNELKSIRDGLHFEKPAAPPPPPPPPDTTEVETRKPVVERAVTPTAFESEEEDVISPFWINARRTLLVVIGLISVAIAAMMVWAMTTPDDVKLPNLVGKPLEQAESLAAAQKFEITVRSEQWNEDFPAQTIYYMNPAPGRSIKTGKNVDVWVSKGSKFATVPDLVKMPIEEARVKIVDASLDVGEVSEEYSDEIPAGNVIKQTPEAATKMDKGQKVNLVYSLGPEGDTTTTTETDNTSTSQTRNFGVKFKVPAGAEDQKIEIAVQDDYGESTAYSEIMHPGDQLDQTVQGVGKKVTIRIYIDGKLVKEDKK